MLRAVPRASRVVSVSRRAVVCVCAAGGVALLGLVLCFALLAETNAFVYRGGLLLVGLLSAVLIVGGFASAAWLLSAAIAIMVALDASVDFCALCFVVARLDRLGFKFS